MEWKWGNLGSPSEGPLRTAVTSVASGLRLFLHPRPRATYSTLLCSVKDSPGCNNSSSPTQKQDRCGEQAAAEVDSMTQHVFTRVSKANEQKALGLAAVAQVADERTDSDNGCDAVRVDMVISAG